VADVLDPAALFRLDGRVAVVTGASSGLGERFARVLHAAGATVVAAARRADRLEALAGELPGLVPVVCDVADEASVAAMVATAVERAGTVDILVNNAGIESTAPAESQTLADFRRVVDVNLVGLFHVTQLCGRLMIEAGGGVVVNMSSIAGLVAAAPVDNAAYCATKGAVVQLTRELAVQWAPKGVRVNAIAPGWFPTEMSTQMFDTEGGQSFIRRYTPLGRGGLPHELDGALLFLASDASSYVTGHTLLVDGGWTAR
jgi:NAD(P)-dependent dehydrogenase (short-subunit alcohol dehydrogenase family)